MQIESVYEHCDEFSTIADALVKKYSQKFFGVDTKRIRAVVITNKERTEKNPKLWDIKAVPMPVRLDCPFAYYVIMYSADWEAMQPKTKNALVAEILHAIPVDDNGEVVEGKLNAFDLKDFASMVRTLGVDYLSRDDIPNILDEEVEWKD